MQQRQGGAVGEWRLDTYGAWSWQEASPYEGTPQRSGLAQHVVPASTARARSDWEPTPIFRAIASEWERHRRDDGVGDVAGHRRSSPPADERNHTGGVPAPPAGTGPLPVPQPPDASSTRDLPVVRAVPPPPPPHGARRDDVAGHRLGVAPTGERDRSGFVPGPRSGSGPVPTQRPRDARGRDLVPAGVVPPPPPRDRSLEDEMTRRAQRRRRPPATTPAGGGRHALRPRDGDEPTLREDRTRSTQ